MLFYPEAAQGHQRCSAWGWDAAPQPWELCTAAGAVAIAPLPPRIRLFLVVTKGRVAQTAGHAAASQPTIS